MQLDQRFLCLTESEDSLFFHMPANQIRPFSLRPVQLVNWRKLAYNMIPVKEDAFYQSLLDVIFVALAENTENQSSQSLQK